MNFSNRTWTFVTIIMFFVVIMMIIASLFDHLILGRKAVKITIAFIKYYTLKTKHSERNDKIYTSNNIFKQVIKSIQVKCRLNCCVIIFERYSV